MPRLNNICWRCQGKGYRGRYGTLCDACGGTGTYRRLSKEAVKAQLELLGIDPAKPKPKLPTSDRILKVCNADVKERDFDPYTDPLPKEPDK